MVKLSPKHFSGQLDSLTQTTSNSILHVLARSITEVSLPLGRARGEKLRIREKRSGQSSCLGAESITRDLLDELDDLAGDG